MIARYAILIGILLTSRQRYSLFHLNKTGTEKRGKT